MNLGALVWLDVGRGKGEHPGIVLAFGTLPRELIVVSGTSTAWAGVARIEVDPTDAQYRRRLSCLSHTTYFHATAVHRALETHVRVTPCHAPLKLRLELEALIGSRK